MNKQSCVLSYVVVKCAPSLLNRVVPLRFEHRLTEPKSVVLPLHQETKLFVGRGGLEPPKSK